MKNSYREKYVDLCKIATVKKNVALCKTATEKVC